MPLHHNKAVRSRGKQICALWPGMCLIKTQTESSILSAESVGTGKKWPFAFIYWPSLSRVMTLEWAPVFTSMPNIPTRSMALMST